MTNYERIRDMSVDEMAEWLHVVDNDGKLTCSAGYKCTNYRKGIGFDCISCYIKWLNDEVKQ